MDWKPGLILRIRNYKFEDDNSTRDKYAIVLCTNNNEAYLIHSLTTSQNSLSVPGSDFGCSVYRGIPYYFIPQGQIIGDQQFYFDKDTFIFFMNNVRKESYSKLERAAEILFGVTTLGVLSSDELKRLIKCALKSRYIPEEIEKELTAFKETL
jgi:hypothetical protein